LGHPKRYTPGPLIAAYQSYRDRLGTCNTAQRTPQKKCDTGTYTRSWLLHICIIRPFLKNGDCGKNAHLQAVQANLPKCGLFRKYGGSLPVCPLSRSNSCRGRYLSGEGYKKLFSQPMCSMRDLLLYCRRLSISNECTRPWNIGDLVI
jgi:hypothetical protein